MNKTLITLAVAALAMLSGCANHRESIQRDNLDSLKAPAVITDAGTAANLDIEVIEMSKSSLIISREAKSDPVPEVTIKGLSINEGSIYDAMQILAEAGGLSLSITGGPKALERYGAVSIQNLNGTLESILEKTSKRMGFFWRIDDDMLIIDQEQRFVTELPPILLDDSLAGLTNTLQHLGIKDVYLDRSTRSLTFRADRKTLKDAENYLRDVREKRSMIVYDISVYQVDLNDGGSMGVNWNKLNLDWTRNGLDALASVVNPVVASGTGINLTLNKGTGSIAAVLNFLETQGSVKTITQPRLTVMNGGKSRLEIGNKRVYVASVGTAFGSTINQVTTTTATIATGVSINITGDFSDGTIYTQLSVDLSQLTNMGEFQATGVTQKLPETAIQQLENSIRSKPGDMTILGGLIINNDGLTSSSGLAGSSKNSDSKRSELVIAVRAKVIKFVAPKANNV